MEHSRPGPTLQPRLSWCVEFCKRIETDGVYLRKRGKRLVGDRQQAVLASCVATHKCDGVCDEFAASHPEVCPQDGGGGGREGEGEGEGGRPPPNPEKCPDGVCDAAEQADPLLCPEDCQ